MKQKIKELKTDIKNIEEAIKVSSAEEKEMLAEAFANAKKELANALKKEEKKGKPKPSPKPQKKETKKPKKKEVVVEEIVVRKKTKPIKKTKTVTTAKENESKRVPDVSEEISLIKRASQWQGKEKTKKQVRAFQTTIKRLNTVRVITKKSKYVKEINEILAYLGSAMKKAKFYDSVIYIDFTPNYDKYKEIGFSEKRSIGTTYILRFVKNLIDTKDKKGADRLLLLIERAKKDGRISKADTESRREFIEIEKVEKSLNNFVSGKTKTIEVANKELSGLQEVSVKKKVETEINEVREAIRPQINIIPTQEDTLTESIPSRSDDKIAVIKATDLKNMKFESVKFNKGWEKIIGNPSLPFYLMVFGQGGGGKSTFSISFAEYLASEHNLKILYVPIEEQISRTLKDKFDRTGAIDFSNIDIAKRTPIELFHKDLSIYDVIFIDSISHKGLKLDILKEMKETYPALSIVYIMHATKDNNYKGETDWLHFSDLVIDASEGIAKTVIKNRFDGVFGEMQVF